MPLKSSFWSSQNNIISSDNNLKQPTKENRPTRSTQCEKRQPRSRWWKTESEGTKPKMNSWYALITFAAFSSLNFANRKINESCSFSCWAIFMLQVLCADCFLVLWQHFFPVVLNLRWIFRNIFFYFRLWGTKSFRSCLQHLHANRISTNS